MLKTSSAIFFITLLLALFPGCRETIQSRTEVYSNDFESGNLSGLTGVTIAAFNNTHVAGFYNNEGFTLTLPDLPKHGLIEVSFDLYIHDTWAGNNTGNKDVADGPDIWEMHANGQKIVSTTFSNSGCFATYCQQQSYPRNYPFHNDAGSGATRLDLPGVCQLKDVPGGSSMYRIVKLFNHKEARLILRFEDHLKQSNSKDQKCDESWSLDNLTITAIAVE